MIQRRSDTNVRPLVFWEHDRTCSNNIRLYRECGEYSHERHERSKYVLNVCISVLDTRTFILMKIKSPYSFIQLAGNAARRILTNSSDRQPELTERSRSYEKWIRGACLRAFERDEDKTTSDGTNRRKKDHWEASETDWSTILISNRENWREITSIANELSGGWFSDVGGITERWGRSSGIGGKEKNVASEQAR